RFAMALSMGLHSGMVIEDALQLASRVLEDVPLAKERVDQCVDEVGKGSPLAGALEHADLMPKTECRLLSAGLRSGAGDLAMEQITERMTERTELTIAEKVSRVEPTLVIITSLLVGMILLAVMLPLVNIMSTIG
ncbi:MAG: type II secretion system F family protein, partial [Clostridia bacterium]|nr:type II secretion system F family protein [Clostridia bacterium]